MSIYESLSIKPIKLSDINEYIAQTKREGMAGFSEKAHYYGAYVNDVLVGFTSIQYFANKVKFNNHYIFNEYRGRGYFRQMLNFSINTARSKGYNLVEAACTKMSINEYIKRGAVIIREYKICTNIKLEI